MIAEDLSISDQVKVVADEIYDTIVNKCDVSDKKYHTFSNVMQVPYIEDSFLQNTHQLINNVDFVKVHFLVYLVESENECKFLNLNCSADYEEKTLDINTTCINGVISPSLKGEVYHEVEHLFQYGKGFKKSEKTSNLYDIATKNATGGNGADALSMAIGRCFYMTFTHEQDAYTHQFYGELIGKDTIKSFEEEQNQFSQHQNFLQCVKILKDWEKDDIRQELNDVYGYDIASFNKRIHFGYKRLCKKLYNAYLKAISVKSKNNLNAQTIQESINHFNLQEKYGYLIHFDEQKYRLGKQLDLNNIRVPKALRLCKGQILNYLRNQ